MQLRCTAMVKAAHMISTSIPSQTVLRRLLSKGIQAKSAENRKALLCCHCKRAQPHRSHHQPARDS
jgi:hypothetical protein